MVNAKIKGNRLIKKSWKTVLGTKYQLPEKEAIKNIPVGAWLHPFPS
jgi:hypothetical protein